MVPRFESLGSRLFEVGTHNTVQMSRDYGKRKLFQENVQLSIEISWNEKFSHLDGSSRLMKARINYAQMDTDVQKGNVD